MCPPLISIIIPSYNQGKYIENTILSAIHQEYSNWEMIIQDACSIDSTADICKKYSNQDSRIHFFQEKDKGFADAVNIAIQKSKGTIGCIQSSDDFFFNIHVFTNVLNIYSQIPEAIIVSGKTVYVNESLNKILSPETPRSEGLINPEEVFHLDQGATFFSINRAKSVGGLDLTIDMVADTDFWCRMAGYFPVQNNSIFTTNQIWSCVTIHSSQRSADQNKFYTGRAKMAINQYRNENIAIAKQIRYNRAIALISDALNYCYTTGSSSEEMETLYKKFTGKKVSLKMRLKKNILKNRIIRYFTNKGKNISTSSLDMLQKYSIGENLKWF